MTLTDTNSMSSRQTKDNYPGLAGDFLQVTVEFRSTSQLLQRRRRRGVCLPSTSGTAERVHKHTQGKGRRLLLSPLVSLTLFTTISFFCYLFEYNPHNFMAGHI